MLNSLDGIISCQNSLQNNWKLGDAFQPVNSFKSNWCIKEGLGKRVKNKARTMLFILLKVWWFFGICKFCRFNIRNCHNIGKYQGMISDITKPFSSHSCIYCHYNCFVSFLFCMLHNHFGHFLRAENIKLHPFEWIRSCSSNIFKCCGSHSTKNHASTCLSSTWKKRINPLRPNNDEYQISPCNINAYSTLEVMRIKGMINGDISWHVNNFSLVLLQEKYGDKIYRRICFLIVGVKGLLHGQNFQTFCSLIFISL